MLELAGYYIVFSGLFISAALVTCAVGRGWYRAFREKERDEFNASYEASDKHANVYQKSYKRKDVTQDTWIEDYKGGFGYDPRFWQPPG